MHTRTRIITIILALIIPLALLSLGFKLADEGSLNLEQIGKSAAYPGELERALTEQGVRAGWPLFAAHKAPASQGKSTGLEQIYLLELDPDADVIAAAIALKKIASIAWAEPDYLAEAAGTPNDPLYPQQWGLAKIQAASAWDVETGSNAVVIAVLDSGVQMNHADLDANLWTNPGEVAGNGLDDDNNGYIDDIHGWDFVNDDNDPSDDNGHGTQVAGIAAAETDNSTGVAGVCWDCQIMPVKVMQVSGVANYSDIAAGVLYAAQKGAEVINLSLGGYAYSSALQAAVQSAVEDYGCLVVGGAGNDNLSTPFYPAAYEQVLAVAGTDASDVKVGSSNYGAWVDLSAPGESITTTYLGGDWGAVNGTSYAAPFVSGLGGLLISAHLDWSAELVAAQMLHTAQDIESHNPGYADQLGSGRINANQALQTTGQPLLDLTEYRVNGVLNGRPEPGSAVDLTITLYNDWASATNVQATLTSSDAYVSMVNGVVTIGDIDTYQSKTNATALRFNVSGSAPHGYDMNFTLKITASGGYSVNIPLTVQTSSALVYPPATLTTQTWTSDRIYVINKETGVPAGNTLTIQPGTEIRFKDGYSLSIMGALIADGSETQPILFTSDNSTPSAGDWGQIKFLDSSVNASFDVNGNYVSGSILRNAVIEYGDGISLASAAPYISTNQMRQISGAAIDGSGEAGLVIDSNQISQASNGIQVDVWGGSFLIQNNTISNGELGIGANGPGEITRNKIEDMDGLGISAQGVMTVTANRIVDCTEGLLINNGYVSNNLLANNASHGLRIQSGEPTVISNTLLENGEVGILIEGGAPLIQNNNLIKSQSGYALRNSTASAINATKNWWGANQAASIQAAIYDGLDQFGLGIVNYSSYLNSPESSAPAYVHSVTLDPPSPVGIETVEFEVQFSRPMDFTKPPVVNFQSVEHNTWTVYNLNNSELPNNCVNSIVNDSNNAHWIGTDYNGVAKFNGEDWVIFNTNNSELPDNSVYDIAIDNDGKLWFGTNTGGVANYDGVNWKIYNTLNSGLPDETVSAITVDLDGSLWFGTIGGGVAHFDGGNWIIYNTENSGLPNNYVGSVKIDLNRSYWFGTWGGGVANFDGNKWTVYDTSNSSLPDNNVWDIEIDQDGTYWFGTNEGGAAHFDGNNWIIYNENNSGLESNVVNDIAIDLDGSYWFGCGYGLAYYDGNSWVVYNTQNSDLPHDQVQSILIDPDGSHWFGTIFGGVGVLWNRPIYSINNNAQWLSNNAFRASYDIDSLVPRGNYNISLSGITGSDEIEIAPIHGYNFTVDYAGAIGDTTAPPVPIVNTCAGSAAGNLYAGWKAYDPDSSITLYRYAIGTTPGGTDVVNWTDTTQKSFSRTDLNLIAGRTYYISVKARNEGGIWSAASTSPGVKSGSGVCSSSGVLLPLVLR